MRTIAIVGAGESGLQLALGLRGRGYAVTLVSDRSAEQIRTGDIMSSQCVFGSALHAQEALDPHTSASSAGVAIRGIRMSVATTEPLSWIAELDRPALSVDQRLKCSDWIEQFVRGGGDFRIEQADEALLEKLAAEHDLVVVSTGKGDLSRLFARDRAKSPFDRPQRVSAVCYVERAAIDEPDSSAIRMNIVPGVGEFFTFPGLTLSGECQMMVFEGIPGGPMDRWSDITTPDEHLARALEILAANFPHEAEIFAGARLSDDGAVLRGRITPTVRRPVGVLASGRRVLGIGDALVLNDPLTGQGSNNAAMAAQHYEDAIARHGDRDFDERWMTRTFEEFWRGWGQWSTEWTNRLLRGLSPEQLELLREAESHPLVASAIVNGFDDPRTFFPWWTEPSAGAEFLANAIEQEGAEIDVRDFRNALGQFATGVTVITTLTPDGRRVGMTANSFTSVSMDPPLVLWCPSKRIPSLADFEQSDHFAINVLATEQHMLSRQFATPAPDKFEGVDLDEGIGGVPLIEGAVARFECRTVARHDAGDHFIYVGEVEKYHYAPAAPLVFHAGQYHDTADHAPTAEQRR